MKRLINRNVALRKESVDRNHFITLNFLHVLRSLSARRAWIEIALIFIKVFPPTVALRKESVDRNRWFFIFVGDRIWVALRKESVDRNIC